MHTPTRYKKAYISSESNNLFMTEKSWSILEASLDDAKKVLSRVLMNGYATDISAVRAKFKSTLYKSLEKRLSTENLPYNEMCKYLNSALIRKVSSEPKYSAYINLFRINFNVDVIETIQTVAEKQGILEC